MLGRWAVRIIILAGLALVGCGGSDEEPHEIQTVDLSSPEGEETPPPEPAPEPAFPDVGRPGEGNTGVQKNPIPVTIAIRSKNQPIAAGTEAVFEADVSGVVDPKIIWRIREGEAGGSINQDGTYLAPLVPGRYHIVAELENDPEKTAEVAVEVIPFSLRIEPSEIKLYVGKSETFTAVVPGSSDPRVTWSIREKEAGGSITPDGVYTAPAVSGLFHIVATSRIDPTQTASASVTVEWRTPTVPRFAYAANSDSNDVSMYSVDSASGRLRKIGDIGAGDGPFAVTTDPAGRFVYVGNFGSNDLSMYQIDQERGSLTPLGTLETGSGPYSLAVHPSGRYLYAATENSPANLDTWIYEIDPVTGKLTKIATVPSGISPIAITLDFFGTFAYVANTSSDNITLYQIDATTGLLKGLGFAPAGSGANSVAVHPTGKFAYAANYGSNDVWAYQKNEQGLLKKIGTVEGGVQPFSMAVDPSGRFAYVANSGTDDVWMYRIDPDTGLLTKIGTVDGGTTPRSITVDPSGRFVYVANLNSNDVTGYEIDPDSGLLKLIGNFPAGKRARSVKVTGTLSEPGS